MTLMYLFTIKLSYKEIDPLLTFTKIDIFNVSESKTKIQISVLFTKHSKI